MEREKTDEARLGTVAPDRMLDPTPNLKWRDYKEHGLLVRVAKRLIPALAAIAALTIIWSLLSIYVSTTLSTPWAALSRAFELMATDDFTFHMTQSLRRVFVGFVIAFVAAIAIGIYMGTNEFGEKFFEPLVVLGLTIPGLMWALIAVMLFGLTETTSYFAVSITIVPMLTINTWSGVKSLDKELIDMANVIGISPLAKIGQVILPQLIPHLFAATRYGLGLAWKAVVIVEMFGASNGVGYQVLRAYEIFDMENVIAWTLAFVAVMIIIEHGFLSLAEKRLTRWRPKADVWRR